MSIIVRPYEAKDRKTVEALHRMQNFGYEAPDWSKMLVSAVVEVDGQVAMASFLRKTAETYLLLDPDSENKKREKLGQLLILHKEIVNPALKAGLTDFHCWLPPQIDLKFGRLLMHLGWEKPLWTCYSKAVE